MNGDKLCGWCGKEIQVMCFMGTDHCCEDCRKRMEGEL